MPGIVPGELGRVDALYANFKRAEVCYWPISTFWLFRSLPLSIKADILLDLVRVTPLPPSTALPIKFGLQVLT